MNYPDYAAIGITGLLYTTFLAGLYMIAKPRIGFLIQRGFSYSRLKGKKRTGFPESRLDAHLRLLLQSVLGRKISPRAFEGLIGTLFIGMILLGYGSIPLVQTLLSAAIMSSLPYLLLRIRLETLRRKSSYEGENLIASFLSQYRIRQFNIYETIEGVISERNDLRLTNKLLFRLLIDIRSTGSEILVRDALKRFSFAINTNWSKMLANCIKTAALSGTNVSLALEDLLIQLREARAIGEERKRLNSEAVRMTVFMVPIMYLATIFLTVNYIEMPLSTFIRNQFYTREGFTLFLLSLFLFMLNLMCIEIIQNKRFDY